MKGNITSRDKTKDLLSAVFNATAVSRKAFCRLITEVTCLDEVVAAFLPLLLLDNPTVVDVDGLLVLLTMLFKTPARRMTPGVITS